MYVGAAYIEVRFIVCKYSEFGGFTWTLYLYNDIILFELHSGEMKVFEKTCNL